MNIIQEAILETEDLDWRAEMHDFIMNNTLQGKAFIEANMNPFYEWLQMANSHKFRTVTESCAKSSPSSYSPLTQTVMPARSFLKTGTIVCRHLLLERIPDNIKIKKNQAIEVVSRYQNNVPKVYFFDELHGVRFEERYGWRVEIKGSTWGGSTAIHEYDALILLKLGVKPYYYGEKDTVKQFKRMMQHLS